MWNIFALEPEALKLYSFKDVENLYSSPELKKHYGKLTSALDNAISLLGEEENLSIFLKELGNKHVGYGVKKEHYNIFGRAMLATIEARLNEEYTQFTKQSWISLIKTFIA
jgi:hemoglobin-like flavoprotein